MNKRTLFTLASCLAAVCTPCLGQAHFLWVSLNPMKGEVAVGLQEVPTQDPLPLGSRMASVKAFAVDGRGLPLTGDKNWLEGTTTSNCAGASLDYGVIDRRDGGRGVFWLKYYAKAAATLGASLAKLNLPVEIFAKAGRDGNPIITVTADGIPAPDAAVVVEDKDGKPIFEGKTASDGTAPLPPTDGPLAVRVLITDTRPGTHQGKQYELTRSYCTLTVTDPKAKPLMQLLRESFGDMHTTISNSGFISTVMGGKLTRTQLEAHLQQRALVHSAIDRILARAHIEPPVFNRPQKEVTDLLRSDMTKMAMKWPSARDAWPLTADLLAQIRESRKKGPFFALGVFHVYYGGITHGGRDIGSMITNQVKGELTYYEKSDGYDDYARAIDQITDPEAQQEMIRGANATYRYLIAINNDARFKS